MSGASVVALGGLRFGPRLCSMALRLLRLCSLRATTCLGLITLTWTAQAFPLGTGAKMFRLEDTRFHLKVRFGFWAHSRNNGFRLLSLSVSHVVQDVELFVDGFEVSL